MTAPWSSEPPLPDRYYWWRKSMDHEPIVMAVRKSAPFPDGSQPLLAGPWAGGMQWVKDMGGYWQIVNNYVE